MSALLDSDEGVAEKDRLYRALDRMVEHKEALEEHLSQRWKRSLWGHFRCAPLRSYEHLL
jgi:hypothetical protein